VRPTDGRGRGRLSDLIYWPGEYFGDDNQRELTPEQILDIAQGYRSDLA
jgi:hypothetical protein